MTKRTSALAAAAKISSEAQKIAKGSGNKATKKSATAVSPSDNKKKKPSSAAKSVANENATNIPWYNIFTKGDSQYDDYMANEWGVEKRGDVALFEKVCLEGAQSGLSWLTILRKREAYRKAFHNFDIDKVAKMTGKDVQKILDTNEEDPRNMIVRHRGKIEAVINNAKRIQTMCKEDDSSINPEHGVFGSFLWSFVQDKPILNTKWKQDEGLTNALSKSPESEAMSKALKKRGFRFVGPTTCYAMMQSCGLVIDHPVGSPEHSAALERLEKRPGGYQRDSDRDVGDDTNRDVEQQKPKAKRARVMKKGKSKK